MTIRSAITDLSGGVIRLSEVADAKYGDEFVYSIPFRFISHDVIEFIGFSMAQEKIRPSAWRVLMNECHRLGAKQAVFSRRRKDGTTSRRFIQVRQVAIAPPIPAEPAATMWPSFIAALNRHFYVRRLCVVLWCLFAFGLFASVYLFSAWYVFRHGFLPEWGEVMKGFR